MAKNIVLCSDGTGNKGGYGNDSNVYKIYQAIDIHHSTTQQISFYDNGVGTKEDGSAVKDNKFWVALSGAFGFGFNGKVRDLYEFLARHYNPGDQIFIFGFSRGAATVRAFTGFLHTCGLIDKTQVASEKAFQTCINQALKAYEKRHSNPEQAKDFKAHYAIKDNNAAPDGNIKIHFIGVWDTVSALGFPDGTWKTTDLFFSCLDKMAKSLELWSDKHWPHQYYDYKLNDSILYACQALAIDDERKTFHPKVWNESQRKPGSVEQVWFAGAHSNVGGGYPRSGLSNVALQWMMTKARAKGLVLITDDVSSIDAHANGQGKLYDSRDGLGIYYRYEPRNITQLCISQRTGKPKIEPGKIKIHNSVIERVKQGTALYAPVFLPARFEVAATNSDVLQPASFKRKDWQDCQQDVHEWVEKRQGLYRSFIEITLILLLGVMLLWAVPPQSVEAFLMYESSQNLPACGALQNLQQTCFPEAMLLFPPQQWLYDLVSYIFPALFKNFIVFVICIHPWLFILMMATLVTLYLLRRKYQTRLSKALLETRTLLSETLLKQ